MPLRFNPSDRASQTFKRIICRALLLLFACSLLASAVVAQSDQETNRATAKRLLEESRQLRREGSKESLQATIPKLEKARPIFHSLNDILNEALVVLFIGRTYSQLGEQVKALDYYEQAVLLYRAGGDKRSEVIVLNNIAGVYYQLGDRHKALKLFEEALSLSRSVADRFNQALTLGNLGSVYSDLGEKQKALDYHTQALPLYRALGDRAGEAGILNNIGLVYSHLGEKQKALTYFAQALPIQRAIGDREGEGVTLINIGSAQSVLGERQKALDSTTQALSLFRIVGDRGREATALNNLGQIYYEVGEHRKALDYVEQALVLKRAVGDKEGEGDMLHNIGSIYSSLDEYHKAFDYYGQALPLRRAAGDRAGEAMTLNNIGKAYRDMGERRKALDFFNQALPLYRAVGDRDGEAVALLNIGDFYESNGETPRALDYYGQALALFRAVGDRDMEAGTLGNMALVARNAGNLTEARARIEAAITIMEGLRNKISSQELRSSYFATVADYYGFYIDILMHLHKQHPTAGHDAEALGLSERARARSLLETLAEANADIRQGVDPQLVERELSLQRRLNHKAQLQSGRNTTEDAALIARDIEALKTEFQQVQSEIRKTSPRYAALTQPQPLSLKEIQTQVIDADTILLEYSLGADRSYLWAVTPTSITSYELPSRADIEAVARQVYAQLKDKTSADDALQALRSGKKSSPRQRKTNAPPGPTESKGGPAQTPSLSEAATQLSQILLAPVAAKLGNKRLLIVADGALQYIPFGALPSPTGQSATNKYQPLVVDHEIVTLPSASTLAVLRQEVKDRKAAPKTVAVLADPVFESDDERLKPADRKAGEASVTPGPGKRELPLGMERAVTESGLRSANLEIPRLPGTRQEARQILALVSAAEGKQALDFSASRQTAMSAELSQYRYVHFATHGFLNSVHPELSGIVFSMIDEKGNPQDGFLRAHEVFNLKLPAELVVLSACQTGLGKEVRGEGLVGLTRGFMYAGTPRVIVSLWSVNDEATAELMAEFYRGVLRDNLRPAAALRAAQVSLMKKKNWQSPFYWAAFTLQGEWR